MDGLGYGDNTKAAVIRLGLMEMIKFAELFYPGSQLSTFFESCGIADLVTTCYGGRNRRVSEAFVKTKKVRSLSCQVHCLLLFVNVTFHLFCPDYRGIGERNVERSSSARSANSGRSEPHVENQE